MKTWGHVRLSRDMYDSNPFAKTRGNQPHVVWSEVKFLKKNSVHGTTVYQKYAHVCLTHITSVQVTEALNGQNMLHNLKCHVLADRVE